MRTALLLLALAAASPAYAGNNELTIGGTSRSLRTASANAVTADNLGGMQITAARHLRLDLVPNLQIWGAIGFASASADGELFGMPTSVDSLDLTLGANARYVWHPHVAFIARLDLGPSRSALAIRGNGHEVSDARWGMVGGAAVGVDLLLLAFPRFGLGGRFEVGYVTHSSTGLSPAEASSSNMLELSESQASIGHLDLGGRYLAFSLLSQF